MYLSDTFQRWKLRITPSREHLRDVSTANHEARLISRSWLVGGPYRSLGIFLEPGLFLEVIHGSRTVLLHDIMEAVETVLAVARNTQVAYFF